MIKVGDEKGRAKAEEDDSIMRATRLCNILKTRDLFSQNLKAYIYIYKYQSWLEIKLFCIEPEGDFDVPTNDRAK
jgi:hypothetical protein